MEEMPILIGILSYGETASIMQIAAQSGMVGGKMHETARSCYLLCSSKPCEVTFCYGGKVIGNYSGSTWMV